MSNASHFILFNDIKNLIMNKYRTMPEEILIFRLSACILTTIILIHTKYIYIYIYIYIYMYIYFWNTTEYSFIQFQFILHHSLHPTSLHKILPKARNSTVRWGGERGRKKRERAREKNSRTENWMCIYEMWCERFMKKLLLAIFMFFHNIILNL